MDARDEEEEDVFIIMEKAHCTLLDDINQRRARRQPYDTEEMLEIFRDSVEALAYCATSGVAHGDIKPSNILLVQDSNKRTGFAVRLSDFGTSIQISEERSEQLIYKESMFRNVNKFMTPLYASPSIVQKVHVINYYQEDVFSLGLTFLQVLNLYSSEELASMNINGHNSEVPVSQPDLSKSPFLLRQLITQMLSDDSDKRPSFLELREILRAP